MKRTSAIVLLLILAIACTGCGGAKKEEAPQPAADTLQTEAPATQAPVYTNPEWFEYVVLEDGTAQITGFTASTEKIYVPAVIADYPVTSIGDNAFYGNEELVKVVLPKGITTIGEDAFCACFQLAHVEIPDTVVSIGDGAFSITDLEEITIPNSVVHIGEGIFRSCDELRAVHVLPDHPVLMMEDGVLFDKTEKKLIQRTASMTNVNYTVPEGTLIIGEEAFRDYDNLMRLTIPGSVTTIEKDAFSSCGALIEVNFSSGLLSIEEGAFNYCGALETIVLPDTLESLGKAVFLNCAKLSSVTMPASLKKIGSDVFKYCNPYVGPTCYVEEGSWAANWCEKNGFHHVP